MSKYLSDNHYESLAKHFNDSNDLEVFIIELLLKTGMRQRELCMVASKHIDTDNCSVYCQAIKGSQSRWIPLSGDLRAKLLRLKLLIGSRTIGETISNAPFLKNQTRAMQRLFHKVLTILGDHPYSTHSLRHTFAMRCLKSTGNDVLKVQTIMGHASVTSTVQYLRFIKMNELKNDILKAFQE